MKEKYKLDESIQNIFVQNLNNMGFDSTGLIWENYLGRSVVKVKGKRDNCERFENSVFIIMPYYFGNDSKLCEMPNFLHKETNTIFTWYQNPRKGIYSNVKISEQEVLAIIEDCKNSLKR